MKLISVHSEVPESHLCEVCDNNFTVGLTRWYETELYMKEFGCTRRKYVLECCKHKGVIVNWEERIYEEKRKGRS